MSRHCWLYLQQLLQHIISGRSPCFLRGVPHGQILHPMHFYRILGFPDFPKIRKIGIPENPDFQVFRNFRNPISENPDSRESENPDFQISGLPNLRKSGFPEIRKSRLSDFRGIGCRFFRAVRRRPNIFEWHNNLCLLYTSPSPRDRTRSRMPSSA